MNLATILKEQKGISITRSTYELERVAVLATKYTVTQHDKQILETVEHRNASGIIDCLLYINGVFIMDYVAGEKARRAIYSEVEKLYDIYNGNDDRKVARKLQSEKNKVYNRVQEVLNSQLSR